MHKLGDASYTPNASTLVPRNHGAIDETQHNVLRTPLHQHSSRASYPMASKSLPPSSFKAGFCDAQTPIAAVLTESFLDFAAKEGGVNLKAMGVRPGQRWCVETSRWKEVVEKERERGGMGGKEERGVGVEVPRVDLECTHEGALRGVGVDVLRRFAK